MGIEDPRVLGPLAAFVFAAFVFEIVVPGKAYKREAEENKRLREELARWLPVIEEVVDVSKRMVVLTESVGKTLEQFLDYMDDGGIQRRRSS